jgi:light-regulated signal transduction histidine kinase (bacteriophytochrome)
LVNDILLYSTTDNNNQETEQISIEDIVRSIKQNLTHYLTQKDASIIISKALPTIEAHTTLINNLFHNLIENAIKYNDSEKPTVTIDYEILDQNYLFKISDNGIGIKPEYKELIFVVFKRLHTQKNYEGTGIGLSICKKIVEKYNGDIWLESEEGKGSTFFFTLPK